MYELFSGNIFRLCLSECWVDSTCETVRTRKDRAERSILILEI